MNVLVLNSGSSSLRFQIIRIDPGGQEQRLVKGTVSRIGSHSVVTSESPGQPRVKLDAHFPTHRDAIDWVLRWIVSPDSHIDAVKSLSDIDAVGHRVVHGGERFTDSAVITREVITAIEDCMELAPLHNPANLRGIRATIDLLGEGVPQVAVFDTAFHTTMPETAFLYAIPYQLYRRHKIRRYGFHGTSHRYVLGRYLEMLGLEAGKADIITLHLGNGCSACAIKSGKSFDTSMGFTPLEGLVMGTRSGDVDPALVDFISHKEGISSSETETVLNKDSGLLGISGLTADMRDLLLEESEHQDRRARLAIDIFCRQVKKYIGAYFAELGGADAVVFTGGIGENAAVIRGRICAGLERIGLILDPVKNAEASGREAEITEEKATLKAYVIPTDEELMIARDTVRLLS